VFLHSVGFVSEIVRVHPPQKNPDYGTSEEGENEMTITDTNTGKNYFEHRIFVLITIMTIILIGLVGFASAETFYINSTVLNADNPNFVIDQPGNYIIDEDITDLPYNVDNDGNPQPSIWIKSSDVSLDGQGHKISSTHYGNIRDEAMAVLVSTRKDQLFGGYENSPVLNNVSVRNVVLNSWGSGIYIRNVSGSVFENNTMFSVVTAFWCCEIDTTKIRYNTIVGAGGAGFEAMHIEAERNCPDIELTGNIINGNGVSAPLISLSPISNEQNINSAIIEGNQLSGCGAEDQYCMDVYIFNSTIKDNVIGSPSVGLAGSGISARGKNLVLKNNTVDTQGHSLLFNAEDSIIENNQLGISGESNGIRILESTNITIRGNSINAAQGVEFYGTFFTITDNDFSGYSGPAFFCNNSVIRNSSFNFARGGPSFSGDSNLIKNNIFSSVNLNGNSSLFTDNSVEGGSEYGIYMSGVEGWQLLNNSIKYANTGLMLHDANNNVIAHNLIEETTTAGIEINAYNTDCRNEIFDNYFNNILNVQFSENSHSPVITWNVNPVPETNIMGGPSIGGNYWGSPDGTGFSDTAADTNHDGFADESYLIDEFNVDNFPLVSESATAQLIVTDDINNNNVVAELQTTGFDFFVSGGTEPYTWEIDYDKSDTVFSDANVIIIPNDLSDELSIDWTPPLGSGGHIYNLTVRVTDANGDSVSKTVTIAVEGPENRPPVAAFSADITEGFAPLTVQFTDESTNAVSWDWNFGDGSANSAVQNPSHQYDVGNFTVKLTAINGHGSNTTIRSNYINVTVASPGSINVTSIPAAARIFINGADTGNSTPYVFTNKRIGSYNVYVNKTGYLTPTPQTKPVTSGQETKFNFTLTPDPNWYAFTGFDAPVDMSPVINTANAGKNIPLKWILSDGNGYVSDTAKFTLKIDSVACGAGTSDPIKVYDSTTTSSDLKYQGNGARHYNWKTEKAFAGKCMNVYLRYDNGLTSPIAKFKFK
jgi:PKD repeat protein